MKYFYLLEWAATLVEDLVILCTITTISGRRQQRKSQHYLFVILSSMCLTVLVNFLNSISLFSFITPIISICFSTFVLSRITSTGSTLLRGTACIMAYSVILTVDYIVIALFGVLMGWSENTFSIIIVPGIPRAILLIITKSADVLIYLLARRFLPGMYALKRKYQLVLLLSCLSAYITTQYLFSAILYSGRNTLYQIVIFSWIYILSFVAIVSMALILITKSEQEKQTHMLLKKTNQLLTENYQQLHSFQQSHAKQIHDFNHHLTALKGLEANGKHTEVSEYINSLLSTTYHETALCHSGSDIIDAIINYKDAEAEQLGIVFSFTANIQNRMSIDPVDICGALANQIDNAFDACRSMPVSDFREVKVVIKQVENFVFFRVENTVKSNPFEKNETLSSTKTDTSMQHGLGLKNIRDITDKYNGFLRNEYKDGFFISVVSLCYEPLDT